MLEQKTKKRNQYVAGFYTVGLISKIGLIYKYL